MNEETFVEKVKDLGYILSEQQIKQFKIYCDFLTEYNKHCNLTAIKTENEIYLKHFYDSLMILKYKKFNNEKIIDIGSGAGFPGVPIKIICPDIDLICLDANGKKTQFLKLLKEKLNIDFDVVNVRAEDYAQRNRELFNYVVTRAVSSMPILCELTIPIIKVGGELIAYKGASSEDTGEYAASILGAEIKNIYEDKLPFENAKRTFICIQKKCQTDPIFPRRYEKILKKPLQNLEK